MAKTAAVLSIRLDETVKAEFIQAAESNHRAPNEVLRDLIGDYVKAERLKQLQREAAEINADKAEEEEVMRWIETYSVLDDRD